MGKHISLQNEEDFCRIIDNLEVHSVIEFNSTTFTIGRHIEHGEVVGISNSEECFIISN